MLEAGGQQPVDLPGAEKEGLLLGDGQEPKCVGDGIAVHTGEPAAPPQAVKERLNVLIARSSRLIASGLRRWFVAIFCPGLPPLAAVHLGRAISQLRSAASRGRSKSVTRWTLAWSALSLSRPSADA